MRKKSNKKPSPRISEYRSPRRGRGGNGKTPNFPSPI